MMPPLSCAGVDFGFADALSALPWIIPLDVGLEGEDIHGRQTNASLLVRITPSPSSIRRPESRTKPS